MKRIFVFVLIAAAPVILNGCRRKSEPAAAAFDQSAAKQYPVKGRVVSTDKARGEVTLNAAAIPGFMDAMTMPYKLRTPNILGELHPGDQITATLYVTDTDDLLDQIVITAQGQPDYKPSFFYHELKPGDVVPNFTFLNQSGKQISIGDFKGKALLVTFIYTRCPLPDFCPRMSQNFARIDKALAAVPMLYDQTHLLSLSFDPDYDTPAVLRSYGGAYTGNYSQEKFTHWEFAAPPKSEEEALDKFFDIGVTAEKDKSITHSLSTILIGPDGKVAKWYPTNDWSPEQVLSDIKQVVGKA